MRRTAKVRSARDLGAAIAEARHLRGLTQSELSESTGLHRSYLAAIETGASVVLLDRVFRILRRLGVEVTVILPEPIESSGESSGRPQSEAADADS